MCSGWVVLFFCLSHTELGKVWGQQQTDAMYSVVSEQPFGAEDKGQRSSGRISRAIQGGGVTINTLPENMTHVVVSALELHSALFWRETFTLPHKIGNRDSNKYYTWRSFGPKDRRTQDLWFDMTDVQHGQVRVHNILSNSYKQAVRVALSFDFPFYGHYLRQIVIATGGFIFTGDVTHRMLTTTQYIAPLMADFDPGHSKQSTVQYLDNGEVFVVQWERVKLPGKESKGAFTFQAALYKTGRITFSYQEIPLPLDVIGSVQHPVKVGLSDAFMVASSSPQSPEAAQRTIYEYHRVEIDMKRITNKSAVELTPLPTCLQHDSCELCLSSNLTSGCTWCNVLQRCSDGMDRHRQEWLDYSCSDESKYATCEDYFRDDGFTGSSAAPEAEDVTSVQKGCERGDDTKRRTLKPSSDVKTGSSIKNKGWSNTAVISGVAAALVLLLALILVALCIHCHPTAGLLHLTHRRKRPSLKFQKQQPGYTEVEGEGHDKYSIVEAGSY